MTKLLVQRNRRQIEENIFGVVFIRVLFNPETQDDIQQLQLFFLTSSVLEAYKTKTKEKLL